MFDRKNNLGITLIELVISLTLALFIFSSLSQIYWVAQNNYKMRMAVSQLQENARILSQILPGYIYTAGYMGCARLTPDFPFTNHTSFDINADNKITLEDHFLKIWRMGSAQFSVMQPMSSLADINISGAEKILPESVWLITDCQSAELFIIDEVIKTHAGYKITLSTPLSKLYGRGAELLPLQHITLFTGKNKKDTALYMNDKEHPLISGVIAIKFFLHHLPVTAVNIQVQFKNDLLKKDIYIYAAMRN